MLEAVAGLGWQVAVENSANGLAIAARVARLHRQVHQLCLVSLSCSELWQLHLISDNPMYIFENCRNR